MTVNRKPFSERDKTELLSNPYTFRVTDHRIYFTLAFKEFVMSEIYKPSMTSTKIFIKAGYDPDIVGKRTIGYAVAQIRKEASSEEGLKEPKMPKEKQPKKKDSSAEIRKLEYRVKMLEQQIEFLKKTEHLKKTGRIPLPRDSS